MENCDLIIILGSFQKNTFKITRSICDFLQLGNEIHVQRSGNPPEKSANLAENLTIKCFDWDNFIEIFPNESDPGRKKAVIMLSPEINLAEQFQQLFHVHKHASFNVMKIISIIDAHYFDGYYKNLIDAMAYFADILLIDNNPEIDRNRLKKFLEHCKQKEYYPLPIKIISQYSVKNISELLDDRPRRMTLIFDDLNPIDFMDETPISTTDFTTPTLAQRDKYLEKDDRGRYRSPIETLP
jgi:hypothetical protein